MLDREVKYSTLVVLDWLEIVLFLNIGNLDNVGIDKALNQQVIDVKKLLEVICEQWLNEPHLQVLGLWESLNFTEFYS
jgi:hypothetical protein